jgi:hypothetical protein
MWLVNIFAPEERAHCIHWTQGWVIPKADLDSVKRKMAFSCWEANPDISTVQLVADHFKH